ncbi:hypothetical protein ACEWY4_001570 [Coilia grayii]|uniref:Uncharacterized protein n=1 Tax=Coilia grayii TaxID=363190 RepID=A0ABD1KTE2_9TELE
MDKVLEMRQKYGKRHQTTAPDGGNHCSLKRKQQLTTEIVEGENGQSISEHLKAIDAELKKIRPNFANIEWRMERTLHTRTSAYKTSSASEFFQQFPFLKHSRLLLHKMRLRFGQDLNSLLSMFLEDTAEKIVGASKGPLKTAILPADLVTSTCDLKTKIDEAVMNMIVLDSLPFKAGRVSEAAARHKEVEATGAGEAVSRLKVEATGAAEHEEVEATGAAGGDVEVGTAEGGCRG